ncbi:MAG: response regulator transcription factor [bacterium]|nr:response regulator transcription factor [bacterium]
MNIRVLLADDHNMFRQGLRALLEKEPGLSVVAEAEDGRQALDMVTKMKPDVVVMDVGMPNLNGIEATRRVAEAVPDTNVLALSMHSDRRFVREMFSAGASGYLLKDSAFQELALAIRTVADDRTYLSPGVTGAVIKDFVEHRTGIDASVFSLLTARQREVLQLTAEGNTTKDIAAELRVSVKTVESHRQKIMAKLDVHSIAELTKYAVREGLTSI